MQQACEEAQKFGIPFEIVAPGNEIPDKFSQGKTVRITYVQKVFNGLSIFGVGNDSTKVGCLILDDSHACIDSINNACTIKVEKTSPAFQTLVDIFEEELRQIRMNFGRFRKNAQRRRKKWQFRLRISLPKFRLFLI